MIHTCISQFHAMCVCASTINNENLHSDFVSDIAIFVLKRDVKLQLTNCILTE